MGYKLTLEQEKECLQIFKKYDHLELDLVDRGAFRNAFRELQRMDDDGDGATAKTIFDTCSGDQNYLTLKEFQQVYCILKRQNLTPAQQQASSTTQQQAKPSTTTSPGNKQKKK